MSAQNFKSTMEHILQYEGGFVVNKNDPGGATNMGITLNTLSRWRKRPMNQYDVKMLSRGEAIEIYKFLYWDGIKGDDLPSGIDFVLMDLAVNSGQRRALNILNKALGGNVIHATFDANLINKLNAMSHDEIHALISRICDERLAFLRKLITFKYFGKGWTNRVEHVRKTALQF